MTSGIDLTRLDRLISDAGLGSFELHVDLPRPTEKQMVRQPDPILSDFQMDLDLAARHTQGTINKLIETPRGTEKLLSAIDGLDAKSRPTEQRHAMLSMLDSFSDGALAQKHIPATNASEMTNNPMLHSLPEDCACAVGTDLKTVYVSSKLGFRETFQETQNAAIKSLLLHSDKIGALQDPFDAYSSLAKLFDHDVANSQDDAMMDEIEISTPSGKFPAFGIGFFEVT